MMRRVINGKAYDTETASLVASSSHDSEWSQASWSLYRTSTGAWFEIDADHDGVVDSCTPLSEDEARKWLEQNANHLVEKYFGAAAEASARDHKPRRFSRRTILAAIQVLESLTQAEFSRFLYELGPEFPRWVGGEEKLSLKKRLNTFMGIYDQQPDRLIDGKESIQDVIVEKAASLIRDGLLSDCGSGTPQWASDQQEFCRRLEVDGFVVSEGRLRATLPNDVRLPDTKDKVHYLLDKHNFQTAVGHLDQGLDAHAKGHWAAANSQIRTFFDALLDEICERLDPSTKSLGSGQPRRTKLAAHGFLSRDLNEWDDKGLGFINGLAKRLHPQGSHPGLSDQEDSTFRLHIVLLTARLFLERFDTWRAP